MLFNGLCGKLFECVLNMLKLFFGVMRALVENRETDAVYSTVAAPNINKLRSVMK